MSGYVEDNNNTVFQIFDEFTEFLNCVYYFRESNDKHIRNMALSSMRFHVRAIADFFGDKKHKDDDLIYTDVIDTNEKSSITISEDMRTFINKSTTHITKKRGKLPLDNNGYYNILRQLVLAIKDFIDKCETSLKTEYQIDFQSEDVKIQKDFINKRLEQVGECLINA